MIQDWLGIGDDIGQLLALVTPGAATLLAAPTGDTVLDVARIVVAILATYLAGVLAMEAGD